MYRNAYFSNFINIFMAFCVFMLYRIYFANVFRPLVLTRNEKKTVINIVFLNQLLFLPLSWGIRPLILQLREHRFRESVTHPEPQISQESFKSKGHLDCDPRASSIVQHLFSRKKCFCFHASLHEAGGHEREQLTAWAIFHLTHKWRWSAPVLFSGLRQTTHLFPWS